MWPWFWKWETLAPQIWRLEFITNKIKQNYLNQRDLAPLNKQKQQEMKKFIWSDFVTLLLKYSKVQVCSLQETEQLRHLNRKDNIGIMVGTNMESLYD